MDPAQVIVSALVEAHRVLLTGPTAPDGDSLGACLALATELRRRGAEVVVTGTVPPRYRWLPGADAIVPEDQLADHFPAVVVLDGDRHRLHPAVEARFAAAQVQGIVDHHASTRADGYTHAWIEPRTESTCGMLARALLRWGVPVDRALAELLYTGLVFDTGGFRHSNTRPDTHRLAAQLLETGLDPDVIAVRVLCERTADGLAAMGRALVGVTHHDLGRLRLSVARVPCEELRALEDGDLEGVVDAVLNTVGTHAAALLLERAPGTVKYSLRSRGAVDVARLAGRLHPTGGGHPRAAGASFRGTLDQAEQRLVEAMTGEVDE